MANLLSQNIGTNYKSILNLDATTINTPLDATLRAVTDGMGTSSPLQLSTDQVGISRTVALSAGATNPRLFNEVYTINNSGAQTGTLTGIFLNATETALNSIIHNLMDLQVGGVSKFLVTRLGFGIFSGGITQVPELTMNAGGIMAFSGRIRIKSPSTNAIMFQDSTETSASNLILGLQTSAFPMIKRNGAAIDFRLADDSGYCAVTAQSFITGAGIFQSNTLYVSNGGGLFLGYGGGGGNLSLYPNTGTTAGAVLYTTGLMVGSAAINASAKLQVESTTQGFLPPRMTTTQKNAIATPAAGLIVYDTTLAKLCVYTTAWETITSV
jgi:hypothetical protein